MGGDVRGRGAAPWEEAPLQARGGRREGGSAVGGPLRVWGRWWRSRKICAGPVDAATQCVFCEAGEDARARQASGFPAEVRVNGVHGSGPLSLEWAHQEGEFVGFLQLVQLLVTIAIGIRGFFFLSCLFTKHSTGTTHSRGRAYRSSA